jgi:hypothetical protein
MDIMQEDGMPIEEAAILQQEKLPAEMCTTGAVTEWPRPEIERAM